MNYVDRLTLGRFLVLGRVGMDLNADPPGAKIETAARFTPSLGGSAGNIAAGLARQGAQVAVVSCVSDDPIGRYCLEEMAQYGIDTSHVRVVGGQHRNSLALTETVSSGCQTVIYRNGAADFALTANDIDEIDFRALGAVIVTGTALAAEPSRGATMHAMSMARSAGAVVVLDIDYRAYSWLSLDVAAEVCRLAAAAADAVIGNDIEWELLAGSAEGAKAQAKSLAEKGAWFTVYKMGPEGCTTFTKDRTFDTPVFRVPAQKPTGAGDGFIAGLLAGLAAGIDLQASVTRGAATAAFVVSGIGCASASPDRKKVENFIEQAGR
jgi:5-dehydro-2-deoxygluconokinase